MNKLQRIIFGVYLIISGIIGFYYASTIDLWNINQPLILILLIVIIASIITMLVTGILIVINKKSLFIPFVTAMIMQILNFSTNIFSYRFICGSVMSVDYNLHENKLSLDFRIMISEIFIATSSEVLSFGIDICPLIIIYIAVSFREKLFR